MARARSASSYALWMVSGVGKPPLNSYSCAAQAPLQIMRATESASGIRFAPCMAVARRFDISASRFSLSHCGRKHGERAAHIAEGHDCSNEVQGDEQRLGEQPGIHSGSDR